MLKSKKKKTLVFGIYNNNNNKIKCLKETQWGFKVD